MERRFAPIGGNKKPESVETNFRNSWKDYPVYAVETRQAGESGFKKLKTKSGNKEEVYLNDVMIDLLKGIKEKKGDNIKNDDFVFCHEENGKPIKDIRKSFSNALKKAGLINFRFHDLRHTFASNLIMSGIDLTTVKELMRHKTIEMTLRYSHLSPNHKSKAVEIMGSLMGSRNEMVTNMVTKKIVNLPLKPQVIEK